MLSVPRETFRVLSPVLMKLKKLRSKRVGSTRNVKNRGERVGWFLFYIIDLLAKKNKIDGTGCSIETQVRFLNNFRADLKNIRVLCDFRLVKNLIFDVKS